MNYDLECMSDEAKGFDFDGEFAKLGMLKKVEDLFNVNECEAVEYIVDTYLECYSPKDEISFDDYLKNCRIYSKEQVKELFSDVWFMCISLEGFCEYMASIYDEGFWNDNEERVYSTDVSEDFEKNRCKVNYIGIMMEVERLMTLTEHEIITDDDIKSFCEIISYYGVDIDYLKDDSVDVILDRLDQIIGGIL